MNDITLDGAIVAAWLVESVEVLLLIWGEAQKASLSEMEKMMKSNIMKRIPQMK